MYIEPVEDLEEQVMELLNLLIESPVYLSHLESSFTKTKEGLAILPGDALELKLKIASLLEQLGHTKVFWEDVK